MSEPTEAAKKKIPIWVWIVGGVLVLAGLGSIVGGNDEQAPQQEESISEEETPPVEEQSEESETILLSEAFCNDLESGLSLFQIYEGGLSSGAYETPEEFADLAYGFAATTCEDQLTDNEGLRGYLESWGVDPDTGGDISSSSDYTTGEKLVVKSTSLVIQLPSTTTLPLNLSTTKSPFPSSIVFNAKMKCVHMTLTKSGYCFLRAATSLTLFSE